MRVCWDFPIWLNGNLEVGGLMGIQAVGSQDVGGDGGGSKQSQLARQSSVYSLTLDEVQTQLGDLGKPLTSMNLDELIKSVLGVEMDPDVGVDVENGSGNQLALQRQASLSLTGGLSKKTVDEVWRDIQQRQSNKDREKMSADKQPTLGEITLEDFLVKAGALMEDSLENKGDRSVVSVVPNTASQFSAPGQWIQYQQTLFQHRQQNMMGVYMPGQPIAQTLPMGAGTVLDASYVENQMPFPSPLMGTLSDTQVSSRKRFVPEDPMDKSVDRRQKRMIKNRESAARSRARKQAYTNELEDKVSLLQAENDRLKRRKGILLPIPRRNELLIYKIFIPLGNNNAWVHPESAFPLGVG